MNELLIWILAAAAVAVVLLLWGLSRRRQRQAELDRETVVPTGLEDEPTAPVSTPDADMQAVREVEEALNQRLAEQRAEEERIEAARSQAYGAR